MRCQVELYVAGTVFYEEMEARDYDHARQIALSRNPGATIVGVNAVFDKPDYETSWTEGPSDTYSSSSSSSSDTSGIFALCVLGGGCWLAYEAWKFGSAIIMGAWKWFVGLLPFMTPQLFVGLVLGFFFLVLVLGALDD